MIPHAILFTGASLFTKIEDCIFVMESTNVFQRTAPVACSTAIISLPADMMTSESPKGKGDETTVEPT